MNACNACPTESRDSDGRLLVRWQSGDRLAGSALVARHRPAVLAYLRRHLGEAADDAAQESMAAALSTRAAIAMEGNFRRYVLGIARNHALMEKRGRARRARKLEQARRVACAPVVSPLASVQCGQLQRSMLVALCRLPVHSQAALALFYWYDMTSAEVAREQSMTLTGATSRLWRARRALRKMLERPLNASVEPPPFPTLEAWAKSFGRSALASEPHIRAPISEGQLATG